MTECCPHDVKHVILIPSYNQIDFIDTCIQSLLNQTVRPWKIIISDDCSQDGTYQRLESYKESIIDLRRNDKNLGLFGNISRLKSYAEGHVVSYCSGDDLLHPTAIENINRAFINIEDEVEARRAIFVTNSSILYPNGNTSVIDNYRVRDKAPLSRKLRHGMSFRSTGYGIDLFAAVDTHEQYHARFPKLGYSIDYIRGIDEVLNAERICHLDTLGAVYRYDVGVVSNQKQTEKWEQQRQAYLAAKQLYYDELAEQDKQYLNIQIELIEMHKQSVYQKLLFLPKLMSQYDNLDENKPFYQNFHHLFPRHFVQYVKKLR